MSETSWRTNRAGERWLPAINGEAFASHSSEILFRQVYGNTFDQTPHCYIIVGSDSGLLAQFVDRHLKPGQRYVFIEPDQGLIEQIETQLSLHHADQITFMPESELDFNELSDTWPEYFTYHRHTLVRSLSVVDQINPEYLELWNRVQDAYKLFNFQMISLLGNKKFIDTQLYNVPFNEVPIAHLQGLLKDRTVIVLGGGPTLDSGIEWLRTHRDQVIIAAVGRIARRLQQEGIEPDIYASVDPNDVSYDNSKWMTRSQPDTLLIHTPYAHPSLLAEYPGLRCFTDARYPWNTPNNPDNLLTQGPTVTNTLMSALVFMGARRLYLLGVDFCYAEDGSTHEASSLENRTGKLGHATELTVETYSGRRALTDAPFFEAAETTRQFARTVHEQLETRLYQLGWESARIDEIPHVPFDRIVLNDPQAQQATLAQLRNRIKRNRKQHERYLKTQLKEIQTKQKTFRTLRQLAGQGLKTARQLFNNLDRLDQQTRQIVRIKKKLDGEQLSWAHAFLYNYAVGQYARFLDPTRAQEEQTQEEIKEHLIHYFTAVRDTADDLLAQLDASARHLQMHLAEPDRRQIQTLAYYWLNHQMEGRMRLWVQQQKQQTPGLQWDDRAQKLIDRLNRLYEAKLNRQDDTRLARRLKQEAEKLTRTLKSMQQAFENRDVDALQHLINALSEGRTDRARSAHALAQGYLAELQGKTDTALAHYLDVRETDMLPAALNRIAQIALTNRNAPMAMPALAGLVKYDDRYFITYADLLAAHGDPAGAVLIYDHYLSRHRDHYDIWLKAGKAAWVAGDAEAARQCAEEVRQHADDPALAREAEQLLQHIEAQRAVA